MNMPTDHIDAKPILSIENYDLVSGKQLAFEDFISRFPKYKDTEIIDSLRETDFSRLDQNQSVYLDYTGSGLYGSSILKEHYEMLASGIFGNPHSVSPASLAMTKLTVSARNFVLEYFNADPEEYICVFSQNATSAFKLLAESYPFEKGGKFLLTYDNHNSVNGIKEYAKKGGSTYEYIPMDIESLRADEEIMMNALSIECNSSSKLFAFPAQSNFSGIKHDLKWIDIAQKNGWDVLLDAAAFAPTNPLDLSKVKPDFVCLSFYKMFGYPTGIGCFIAKKESVKKLARPWFAGGSITMASVVGDSYYYHNNYAGFEDGTIDFLNIPAVEIGLRFMQKIGVENINSRVCTLSAWLISEIEKLRHSNGLELVKIYGCTMNYMRGGTIAFNLYDQNGQVYYFRHIESLANRWNISLRTGCFCNPGACETATGITKDDILPCYLSKQPVTFDECSQIVKNKTIGAVRISFGMASNFNDAWIFLNLLKEFLDKDEVQVISGLSSLR